MKIIIVGPFPPYRGGIADLNSSLSQHLAKKHSVRNINFNTQYPGFLFPGKTQYKPEAELDTCESERRLSSINPITWKLTADSIIASDPDLVIFRFWMPFFAPAFRAIAKRIKKRHHAKIMAICDNIIPHEARLMDRFLTLAFFRQVDKFLVMSKKVESELLTYLPGAEYCYSPHPIYDKFGDIVTQAEARRRLHIDPSKKVILHFGLIRQYKGLDLLIRSLPLLKGNIEELVVLIAGECYENQQTYRDLIDELKLTDIVRIKFEFIPDSEIKYYFSAADLVVLPYRSASQSGIVQIAYHFDKPVIVTRVGGLPEIVPDGQAGYVVEPDPDQIAAAVRKYFAGTDSADFPLFIQSYKERFSWDALVAAIEELAQR